MKKSGSLKLPIALFGVAFFWGTTYLAIRIAVRSIPAPYIVGIRHLTAGIIILLYLFFAKKIELPSKSRIFRNIILATLMLVLANGLTTYGEQSIPSGLTAIITTLSPLLVLLINILLKKEKLHVRVVIGVILGLVGMLLIFYDSLTDLLNPEYRTGIIYILIAVICWSIGTVFSKIWSNPKDNILVNLCTQMLFAGGAVIISNLLFGHNLKIADWETYDILAVFYLAIFGSIAGYISYLYALSKIPATSVSVFTYFNVIVAVFLGWLILDEVVTIRLLFATVLILIGVIIANYKVQPK